jgi:UDP-N-acetylglucosamine 1-carboxyvinyltransferase
MSSFVINGGKVLSGEIAVNGSKNAVLPLIAASLLTSEKISIENVPKITDVSNLITILEKLGVDVIKQNNQLVINAKSVDVSKMPDNLVGKLRGSILLVGSLLGRKGEVTLPQPGGDIIGARPIDVHLDALKQLGCKVDQSGNKIHIDGKNLKAGRVVLREFSVTATENIMLVAATLPGKTTIHIAASEPHIVNLAELLSKMGADIEGAGTHTITITGKKKLSAASVTTIPDMLEAGFFILLAAATKSNINVTNVPIEDLDLFFKKLDDIGVDYEIKENTVQIKPAPLKSFSVQTIPHPGIATDLQAPFSVVASQADGATLIHDPMYESRFKHCDEMIKMGASVTVCDPHRVIIEGPTQLHGSHINSLDIRSGATLVMAGLVAKGETIIEEAEIIERGYADLVDRLQKIGADIKQVDTDSSNTDST